MNKDNYTVKCKCGKILFGPTNNGDVYILKGVAVAQFTKNGVNFKCRNCKRWIEGVNLSFYVEE